MNPHDVAVPPHYIHEGLAVGLMAVTWIMGSLTAAMIWHPNKYVREGLIDGFTLRMFWDRKYRHVVTKEMRVRRKLRHRRDQRKAAQEVASTTVYCSDDLTKFFGVKVDGQPITVVWGYNSDYKAG